MKVALISSMLLIGITEGFALHHQPAEVEVLIDGAPIPKYFHEGTTYLEAIKGKEFAIRLTNPTGSRVAVALSVDGLNTIDARHTSAASARKWVLDPYESVVISGWQTDARKARRFFFTTEDRSYGAWLGRPENLGIISAAFFREKIRMVMRPAPDYPRILRKDAANAPLGGAQADASAAPAQQKAEARSEAARDDEYAATGMGDHVPHQVQLIHMDLEDQPFATVNLRYEFRPVLVRLGVLPPGIANDPLARREKARGFRDGFYCPEP